MSFHLRLALVAVAFAVLAGLTSLAVPIYEAPDETIHLDYVFHLRQTGTLPVMTSDHATTVAGQEAFHPPLYYALAALLSLPANPAGYREAQRINWYQQFDRTQPGNKNVVIHDTSEAFPFTGPALAIHLARLASVLCGVVTVVFAGLAAREAGLADSAALLTASLVAALPQFVFLSAVTNSDNAVIAAATAAVYWSLRLLSRGVSAATVVALGATGGLAALAKVSGALIGILAVVGLLLARSNERGPERRSLLCDLTLLTAPMAAIAGWWYLRNLFLYGDPLGWDEMLVLIDAILRRDPSPAALFAEALKLRESSWALFGWGNVGLPDWAYLAFDAVLALSAIGWLLRLRRQPSFPKDGVTPYPLATLLLAGWCAAFALVLARWMAVNEHGGQGRLWFPAIAPFAILFVSGLAGLLPRLPLAGPAAAIAGLGAVAVAAPWLIVRPAYAAPTPPAGPTPDNVQASFAPGLALVGFRLDPERVAPGQRTMLWLWWRIDRPVDGDLAVRLRVLARDFQPISETVSYPAAGTATFDRLPTGTLLADGHSLRVPPDLDAPDYLRIEVDLLDRRTGSTVQSERGLITVGPLRVTGGTWPPPGMERAALEGENALRLDGLRIEQYAPERPESGGSLALLPAWTAATSARSATARITVLDATGAVVTVADRGLGTWHEIRNWRAGDRFVDELDLDLPAGLPSGDDRLQLAIRVDGREAIGIVGTVRR